MKILALIPARGGSKGVPRKNLLTFAGKTLVEWAIYCAANSTYQPTILLDTDDYDIAKSIDHLTDINLHIHIRKSHLGNDDASINDVAIDALMHIEEKLSTVFDILILLQPTSPLRTSKELDHIINIFERNTSINNIVSIIHHEDIHPARMYTMAQNGSLIPLNKKLETTRRQDLDKSYLRNGCFYAVNRKTFIEQKAFLIQEKIGYVMPIKWWLNIDEPFDVEKAKFLFPKWIQTCLRTIL